MKKLPDELRAMSSRDFVYLVATMTKGTSKPKPLDWDEGGEAVAVGWAKMMQKRGNLV